MDGHTACISDIGNMSAHIVFLRTVRSLALISECSSERRVMRPSRGELGKKAVRARDGMERRCSPHTRSSLLGAPLHMADLPGTIGVIPAAEASIHYAMSKQCHGGCAGLVIGVGFERQIAPYSKERLAGVQVDHNLSPIGVRSSAPRTNE
jgi:hypothetical protein